MNKLELRDAILQGFSAELLQAITSAKFGNVSELAMPADVSEAIIATGQANVNFNNAVLVPLSGLPIAELILKNGQLNEIYRGLLYASLEISENYADFEIIEPVDGVSYATGENSVTIQPLEGTITNITCTVYDPDSNGTVIADFIQDNGQYYAPVNYTVTGTWSLTFVVVFDTGASKTKMVEVTVE